MSNILNSKAYIFRRYSFLVICIAFTVLFSIIIHSYYGFEPIGDMKENIVDIVSESINLMICLIGIIGLTYFYSDNAPHKIMLSGLCIFYVNLVEDLFDELSDYPKYMSLFEDICFPLGLVVIGVGLILWLKNQRSLIEELIHLKNEYEQLSIKDNLSGLYNIRYMKNIVPEILEKNEPKTSLICLLMIDIDNFKSVNDTYGHLQGDKVIESLATIILDILPKDCFGFRYGGEEFAVLLQGIGTKQTIELAESIREDFANKVFDMGNENVERTVSIGIKFWDGESMNELVRMADQTMYKAKELGKNQVIITRNREEI